MTTRSSKLGVHRSTLSKDTFVLYRCPVGAVTLVKSLMIQNWNSTPASVQVLMREQAGAVATALFRGAITGGDWKNVEFWTVLEANDQVECDSDLAIVDFWLSGAVLPVSS